jgi:tripartite ATP-independent transporter DctM subunit
LKGGFANVNVVVSMIFAGISGSSTADTAGVGSVLIPAMTKSGYSKGFSASLTAASSTLGNIIPPSILMIMYASTAGISVGALFLTGIIPGILLGIMQMIYARYVASKEGIATIERFSLHKLLTATKSSVLALAIPVIIIGGIVGGIFTATEASVIAVLYSGVLASVYKQASFRKLYDLVNESVIIFSLALFCAAAASIWGWMLAFYNVPQEITQFFERAGLLDSPYFIFAFIVIFFLLVGTFMDAIPAIIIMQPVIGELVAEAGIDPYHMGVVVVLTLAIGLITPPYGLCLFIACDIAKVPVMKVMHSLLPFILISIGIVLMAVFFPDLILLIPRVFMPDYFK